MDAYSYLTERQRLWALRNGKTIDANGWTLKLEDNLFCPLSEASRADFAGGRGNELGIGPRRGKIHAVHSSAAAAVNFFQYWRDNGQAETLLSAIGLPNRSISRMNFEVKPRITGIRGTPPHLDVLLIPEGLGEAPIVVEVKFRELFPQDDSTLTPTYLLDRHARIWEGLPNLLELARAHQPGTDRFKHLDVPQLLTHILGLRSQHRQGFILLYLWCDVPGSEGVKHAQEVAQFSAIAEQDGISFRSMTYQDVILSLARNQRVGYTAYVDYLVERYL
jgi:hypothetical protein